MTGMVHFRHTGLHGLFAHGFGQFIGRNADPEAHRRFERLAHGVALRLGLDNDADISSGTLGANGSQHLLCDRFRRPAGADCLAFDLREFSIADFLNGGNTLTFRPDGG